jgi:hypothetical protein
MKSYDRIIFSWKLALKQYVLVIFPFLSKQKIIIQVLGLMDSLNWTYNINSHLLTNYPKKSKI